MKSTTRPIEATLVNEFLSHFHLLVVDPYIKNIQAIRCYKKSGFEESNNSEDPNY